MKFLESILVIPLFVVYGIRACAPGMGHTHSLDQRSIEDRIRSNNLATAHNQHGSNNVIITNVRIFDGHKVLPHSQTVMVKNGVIVDHGPSHFHQWSSARHDSRFSFVDGNGGMLLPGFTDAHTHPTSIPELTKLTKWGVTTTMVMACAPSQLCQSLQNHVGLTNVLYSGAAAAAPNTTHSSLPNVETLEMPEEARDWVQRRIVEGADFIKIVATTPTTLSEDTIKALVRAGHRKGKQAIGHVSTFATTSQVLDGYVDQIHHTPLDVPLDSTLVRRCKAQDIIAAPTLIMMKTVASQFLHIPELFDMVASPSAGMLHKGSITILTGTDANEFPGAPVQIPFGSSLHDEMSLLVDAGMKPIEVLRSATSKPAKAFGLSRDRGSIKKGMRGDLVLVDGNPTNDISDTRKIKKVWVGGVEFIGQ